MRLAKERIHHMADSLIGRLHAQGFIAVEDRLNMEIRQLMKSYEREIEQGQVDYQKMFTMIKQKLVRERGIIL